MKNDRIWRRPPFSGGIYWAVCCTSTSARRDRSNLCTLRGQFVASTGIDVAGRPIRIEGPVLSEAGCLAQVSQTPAIGNRHFTTRPGEPCDKVNVPITSFVSVSRTVSTIVVKVTDPTYA